MYDLDREIAERDRKQEYRRRRIGFNARKTREDRHYSQEEFNRRAGGLFPDGAVGVDLMERGEHPDSRVYDSDEFLGRIASALNTSVAALEVKSLLVQPFDERRALRNWHEKNAQSRRPLRGEPSIVYLKPGAAGMYAMAEVAAVEARTNKSEGGPDYWASVDGWNIAASGLRIHVWYSDERMVIDEYVEPTRKPRPSQRRRPVIDPVNVNITVNRRRYYDRRD